MSKQEEGARWQACIAIIGSDMQDIESVPSFMSKRVQDSP
jgi:hypothetical protein